MATTSRAHIHRVDDLRQLKDLVGKLVFCVDISDQVPAALYRGIKEHEKADMHKFLIRSNEPDTIVIKLFSEDGLKTSRGSIVLASVADSRRYKEFIYHPKNPDYEVLDNSLREKGI